MALVHTTAVRNSQADNIDALINTGAGTATLEIATTAFGTTLAVINLQNPAFGAAAAGIITLQGVPLSDASADATGTAAVWRIKDRDGTEIVRGTIGTSGTDLIITNTSITAGEEVRITSMTYETHP
jgi:hypothetical protein